MLLGVISLVAIVGGVVLAVAIGRARAASARAGDDAVLRLLAPVVAGTMTRDRQLTGMYRGRRVQVSLEHLDPRPLSSVSRAPLSIEVIRLQVSAAGRTPWFVRSEPLLQRLGSHGYQFVRESAPAALQRIAPMPEAVAVPDPAVEARLTGAGLLAALERLAPPSSSWLPRIRFTPDPRLALMARLGQLSAAIPAGPSGLPTAPDARAGLSVDLHRNGPGEPTAQALQALLDAAIAVAELNEQVNPAPWPGGAPD